MSNLGIRATVVAAFPILLVMLPYVSNANAALFPPLFGNNANKTNTTKSTSPVHILIMTSPNNATSSNNATTNTTTNTTTKQTSAPDCKFFPSDPTCVHTTALPIPVNNVTVAAPAPVANTTKTNTTTTNTTSLPSTAHTCPDGSVADANASCVT